MSFVTHDTALGDLGTIPVRFAAREYLDGVNVEVYRVGTSYIGADSRAQVLNGLDVDGRLYCRPGDGTVLVGLDGIPRPGEGHSMRWELREVLALNRHISGYTPVIPVEELLAERPDKGAGSPFIAEALAEDVARACAVRVDAYRAVKAANLDRPWLELDSRITALQAHQARLGCPEQVVDINPANRWAVKVELELLIDADTEREAAERARSAFGQIGNRISVGAGYQGGGQPRLSAGVAYHGHRPIPHADARLDINLASVAGVTDEAAARAITLANRAAGKALLVGLGRDNTERDNAVGLALLDLWGPNAGLLGPQPTEAELGSFRLDPASEPARFVRAYRDAYAILNELGQ